MLYFLLDGCQDINGMATPMQISKSIVFVDGRVSVNQAAAYLQQALVERSKDTTDVTRRYETGSSGPYCVSNIVETYTSQVSKFDRDTRYAEFKKLDSRIRIMVATTALGMGVNVPDVERVVLWRLPITRDLGDYWQRLGHGGRGEGRTSLGLIFLPYWMFDTEGASQPSNQPSTAQPSSQTDDELSQQSWQRRKNLKPPARPSRLYRLQNAADIELSDADSICSVDSAASQALVGTQSVGRSNKVKYWTKQELTKRAEVPIEWLEMVNGPCHRRAFLSYLGEEKAPTRPLQQPLIQCCSRCTPSLFIDLTSAPDPIPPPKKPRAATRAGIALVAIDQWATGQAEKIYMHPSRPFPMPASAYMPTDCRWQLAYLFDKTRPAFWDSLSMEILQEKAPAFSKWTHARPERTVAEAADPAAVDIVTLLRGMSLSVEATYQEQRVQRRPLSNSADVVAPTHRCNTAAEYNTAMRVRDDTLSKRVALQEARKAAQEVQQEERRQERMQQQQESSLVSR